MSIYFNKNQEILLNALNTESLRYKVISNNIANVDTPNFLKSRVVFESMLKKNLKKQNSMYLDIIKTHPQHIDSKKEMINYKNIKPKIILDYNTAYRNDKNNVDIDVESGLALKSSLRYQAFSQILSRNFKKIKSILNSNI